MVIDFILLSIIITIRTKKRRKKKTEKRKKIVKKRPSKTTRLYTHARTHTSICIYQTIQRERESRQYYRSVTDARINAVEFVGVL